MDCSAAVKKLFKLGEYRSDAVPDYAGLGITSADIPQLIKLATDEELLKINSSNPKSWVPVHAWIALGQLNAKEAIKPLINLFHRSDRNDLIDEEMPAVFVLFGPTALPLLKKYLADDSYGVSPRITAASCIKEIGCHHENEKEHCVQILTEQLEQYQENAPELNGFLVWYLIDLKARASIEVIQEAYRRDCVDQSIVGDLGTVEYELDLKNEPTKIQLFVNESFDKQSNDEHTSTFWRNRHGSGDLDAL